LQAKTSPLAERKWRMTEGSGPIPKDKASRHVASKSHKDLPCHPPPPPKNAHGGRAAEVHCGGLAEGIITAAGVVMTDRTD
jgi:hypothetical protein